MAPSVALFMALGKFLSSGLWYTFRRNSIAQREINMEENRLVLWGHSLDDYREMFDLNDADLKKSILECGAGPTSFNVEMQQRGTKVISSDEMYKAAQSELQDTIQHTFQATIKRLHEHHEDFVLDKDSEFDQLVKDRQAGIVKFLDDFDKGKGEGRYQASDLRALPFGDYQFELALCSHSLFGNRGEENEQDEIKAIEEMCRVAHEVRIFPLIDNEGTLSPFVGSVMLALQQDNLGVEIREVPYRLQKNGNAMMRVWAQECVIS